MNTYKDWKLTGRRGSAGAGSPLSVQAEPGPAASAPVAPTRLLATALFSMASAIFITDANGIIMWVNDAFTRLSGYASHEAVGNTPAILNSGKQDRCHDTLLWETILAGKVWQGEVIDRHKTGRLYVVDQIITPLFDQFGVVSHFIAIQHDITERRQESEHDHYLAYHDVLTGLPNRTSFLLMLQLALARASRDTRRLALLFIDLDKFKPVNDEFGHHNGDQLLSAVGARLRASIRKSDVVARIGGDEFVVVLHDKASPALACKLAEKLLGTLARQFMIGPHRISITGSIGLAFYPDDGVCAQDLMINADSAMYQAKARGGGAYQCFRPEMAAGASANQ